MVNKAVKDFNQGMKKRIRLLKREERVRKQITRSKRGQSTTEKELVRRSTSFVR